MQQDARSTIESTKWIEEARTWPQEEADVLVLGTEKERVGDGGLQPH